MVEGGDPNVYTKVTHRWNERLGRMCKSDPLKSIDDVGNNRENKISVMSPRLFNQIPAAVGNTTG